MGLKRKSFAQACSSAYSSSRIGTISLMMCTAVRLLVVSGLLVVGTHATTPTDAPTDAPTSAPTPLPTNPPSPTSAPTAGTGGGDTDGSCIKTWSTTMVSLASIGMMCV